ncbi:hypothetical protein CCP3SC5AM1_1420006 [Gammaproteobacteria bacterium]
MSWKARLDHLIADGEQATCLESRELLEELLAKSTEERWQVILVRDPRLERLVVTDYQWLLKMTAAPKPSEVAEALATQAVHLNTQWQQYSEQMAKTMESSLAQWNQRLERNAHDLVKTIESSHARWGELLERRLDFRSSLRFFLLLIILCLIILLVLRSDSKSQLEVPISSFAKPNSEELAKIIESSQARWNELLEQRSQDLTKTVESSQARWLEQLAGRTDFRISAWLLFVVLIPAIFFAWFMLRVKLASWREISEKRDSKDLADVVASSQALWGERLERRSTDLLNALELSRTQIDARLEKVLRETAEREERQREVLWRVMAMEEMGLKLIAGNDFQSELMALRAIWGESKLLTRLAPTAVHGVSGRPLLLVTLEHLYGDLLIQREDQKATRRYFWNAWWPFSYKGAKTRNRTEKIENRVARALRELRRGNWNSGIDELVSIDYAPIRHWTETARARVELEAWYAELRQEAWGQHLGSEQKPKPLTSPICFKTCRIPFCKPNRLCLKKLLIRFKK